ncbi:arylacetamide deacetylase-like 2 [Apodemus sylvaticus]|uniref:arylacetamide deacetylase-like 2 n=1 Tax=Apodemus sylvaticus TaxID=10129 RepID=UPI002242C9B7|nr:arylacetamide deacetylase-like 2 [Apodemus sylvaticus]
MRYKTLCFGSIFIFLAYHSYVAIPENIEEPWKVRIIDAGMKISSLMATLLENMGLMKFEEFFAILMGFQDTKPVSDENITVIDTDFSGIPVRLYLPKRKSAKQRPAVIYIHGGAYILGSFKMLPYDSVNRWTTNKLDAVVMAPDYRLAPQHLFPAALEDCIFVVKLFLQDKVLAKYGVDPTRICISGDSSGGTLAATVTQLVCFNDSQLQKLPLTYILTCEHDILRDDGLIYVTRLTNVGVPITHEHIEDGIHGVISFATAPFHLQLGLRLIDKYIIWLKENL